MALPAVVSEKIAGLASSAAKWQEMPDAERATVLRACRGQLATLSMDWVPDNLKCLGIEPSRPDTGKTLSFDPFLFLSTVAGRFDKLAEAYEGTLKVAEGTTVAFDKQLPGDGSNIYKMGPMGQAAPKVDLELWADPTGDETDPNSSDKPGVGVVLGAGNQNFLTAVDVIEVAFSHKKAVLLKHHPLRNFMAAPFAHIFAPLAEAGGYAQCCDADVAGAHGALVSDKNVTHVHMTGSGATHDKVHQSLVAAKRDKEVLFTSELGCVTPWIICPGKSNEGVWPQTSIDQHAAMLTAAFKSSCSMNCLSPKVLVLPSEEVWPQRAAFLKALEEKMATLHQFPPYYPGAHQRFANFEKEYPDSKKIEAPPVQAVGQGLAQAQYEQLGQDITPLPSLLCEVGVIGAEGSKPYALTNEAFSPVLAIATVACANAQEFPMAAAKACNEHVFGTLSCNIIYPDERDEALEEVLSTLNYGAVSVNAWAALMYSNPLGVWGGAPGSYKSEASNSGLGFVGNAARIERPRKAVAFGPFVNKDVVMEGAMPYLLADVLSLVTQQKSFTGMRVMGLLLRRGFGLFKPMPGSCA